jgi:hypothetical protein
MNFDEFMCIYEAKNDKELKYLVQIVVLNASEFIFMKK